LRKPQGFLALGLIADPTAHFRDAVLKDDVDLVAAQLARLAQVFGNHIGRLLVGRCGRRCGQVFTLVHTEFRRLGRPEGLAKPQGRHGGRQTTRRDEHGYILLDWRAVATHRYLFRPNAGPANAAVGSDFAFRPPGPPREPNNRFAASSLQGLPNRHHRNRCRGPPN
jgi:hypothetical protein